MTPLPDDAERRRAAEATDRSLIVEASAGTGKTTTLVARILQLVLGDEGVSLPQIAAMTFTEKAAAEMRSRVREGLDAVIAAEGEDAARRARALEARRDLEAATITTIHSFCSRLLREWPVDAGVDPDFVTLEETVAAELVDDLFDVWLDDEARRPGPVADAIRQGLSLSALRDLARLLYEKRALALSASIPTDPLPFVRQELELLAAEGEAIVEDVPADERGDPKVRSIAQAAAEVRGFLTLSEEELALARPQTPLEASRGRRSVFGAGLRDRAKAFRAEVRDLPDRLALVPRERLLAGVLLRLREAFLPLVEEEKRRQGLLDFDDLLLATRKLLCDYPAARRHFQERYRTFIVDEFQDTDPVQAEIVLRLASGDVEQSRDVWDDLEPAPGALFVVGDPKQSIYRFRRGDVETYRAVAARFDAGDRLSLTTSFRSAPGLVSFVNAVFSEVFASPDGAYDVAYAPLVATPDAVDDGRPHVVYLVPPPVPEDDEDEDAGADEGSARGEGTGDAGPDGGAGGAEDEGARRQEARAVANLLLSRYAGRAGGWGRIGVLVARNDAVDLFQEVFRESGIPAVLEGGTSFFRREETAAVVAALRALDDPTDSVSTVAALKSFLFGLSDLDLLEAAEAGARFDDPASIPPESATGRATALLASLRARRHERPLAETVEALLGARTARAALTAGAIVNAQQAEANLERLLVQARELDAEGVGFRAAVERLVKRLQESVAEPRAFEETEDAVRLLTIHKAKGLEYDVVVVADLGFSDPERRRSIRTFVSDHEGGRLGFRAPFGGERCATPGWRLVEAGDRLRELAEEKRLLYVATTRARHELVLSWFRKRTRKKDGSVSDPIGRKALAAIAFAEGPPPALAPLVEKVEADVSRPAPARGGAPAGEEAEDGTAPAPEAAAAPAAELSTALPEEIAAAEARLAHARATAARPLRRSGEKDRAFTSAATSSTSTASATSASPASPEDLPPSDREDEAQGRAIRIGVAVHAAMERLLAPGGPDGRDGRDGRDRGDARDLARAAVESCSDLAVPSERDEAIALVARLLAHPVVARARASVRRFVELPVLFRDDALPGAPLVEGKIDLLFEEPAGWVIVDWKTDRVSSSEARAAREELYRPQLESYARALAVILGPGARVAEALLVFAREPDSPG